MNYENGLVKFKERIERESTQDYPSSDLQQSP